MPKVRCSACAGLGENLGVGMMRTECMHCDGKGSIQIAADEDMFRTDSIVRARAKRKIKEKFPELSDIETNDAIETALQADI